MDLSPPQRLVQRLPTPIFFSFPLVILIQRANIEIILSAPRRPRHPRLRPRSSNARRRPFGLAAAIKLYPIFLLGLFLTPASKPKDLRAFTIGLATAVLALIAATAYTGPAFLVAARGFTTGLGQFSRTTT